MLWSNNVSISLVGWLLVLFIKKNLNLNCRWKHGHKRTVCMCNSSMSHTQNTISKKRRKDIFPCSCVCVMVCFSPPLSETKIAQWLKFPQLSFWILNINCASWEPFSTDKHTPTTPDLCGMHILSSIHSPECGYYGTESNKEAGDLWLCTVHYPKLLPSPCKYLHLWGWQRRCHIFFLIIFFFSMWEEKQHLKSEQSWRCLWLWATVDKNNVGYDEILSPEGGNCMTKKLK